MPGIGFGSPPGHVFRVGRKRGPVCYAKYRLPGGRQVQKKLGGRVLTVVIEQTVEPTTWLVVTGWSATAAERRIMETSE